MPLPACSENLIYSLHLLFAPGVGPLLFERIRSRVPSLKSLFSLNEKQFLELDVPVSVIPFLLDPSEGRVERHLAWGDDAENYIITLDDPHYPFLLKQIYAPPPVLFVKGHVDVLNQVQLAMVGSRNPTGTGKEQAFYFARELAKQGIAINSGLALGIDGASHEGVLSVDGFSVAVMGTGLDKVYPASHQSLAQKILKKGVWVSEFPLGTPVLPENFPRRNRIISGLSQGVFVVEAALRSGSLITARFALEQGRDVYAMPGSVHNPMAKGCHHLLRQGAKLVETLSDLLEELGDKSKVFPEESPEFQKEILDEAQQSLLECLDFSPLSFDKIKSRSDFSAERVAGILLQLELQGLVRKEAGGYLRTVKCYG